MWQSILSIVAVIASWFSPKQRVLKKKKELYNLENERAFLFQQECTMKRQKRLMEIDARIKVLNAEFKDHACD